MIDGERVGEIVGDTFGPSDGLLFERQVHIGTRKLMNTKQEEDDKTHERVGTTDGVIDGERVGEIVGDTLGESVGLILRG